MSDVTIICGYAIGVRSHPKEILVQQEEELETLQAQVATLIATNDSLVAKKTQ